jgi:SAM-dependent methyltransferase
MSSRRRVDYGVDAPGAVRALALVAGAGVVLAVAGVVFVLRWLFWVGLATFAYFTLLTGLHLWCSKVGKLRERGRLLDAVRLEGDETVLDVGCGRGLLLVEAARRLPNGRAVGIDIWSPVDQSRNEPAAPVENARLEDVGAVAVSTADARDLPFADRSIDAVVVRDPQHQERGRSPTCRTGDRPRGAAGRADRRARSRSHRRVRDPAARCGVDRRHALAAHLAGLPAVALRGRHQSLTRARRPRGRSNGGRAACRRGRRRRSER